MKYKIHIEVTWRWVVEIEWDNMTKEQAIECAEDRVMYKNGDANFDFDITDVELI